MNDLRSAVGQLARNPAFTAIAVLTLALGIGVNSVMFSFVDAVLFRPLPVAKPEELVRIGMTDERGLGLGGVSYPLLKDFEREASALVELSNASDGADVNLSVSSAPVERVVAASVTGNFFSLLGVAPRAGRLLSPDDDLVPGAHRVMVLSEGFWQRRFGSDPRVIGSVVRMNTHPFTVVGVAARGFLGTNLESVPDIWMPLTMAVETSPMLGQFKPFERRGFTWVGLIGRLKPGVTAKTVKARLETINARINRELKINMKEERYDRFRVLPLKAAILEPSRLPDVARSSWILLGVTGLVLVIACAVAAGLLLVRGEQRQRELAIRSAIGASRVRIARQLFAESFLLSAASGIAGIALASWSAGLFLHAVPDSFLLPALAATPVTESRVLWFTAAVAFGCTFVFGLLPAWRASRPDLLGAMKQDGSGFAGGSRPFSIRNAFVVVQIALSVVLLVGAGLLLRSLGEASRVDLGFDARNALVISLDVSKSGYDSGKGGEFYRQLLDQVRQLPGVSSAAISRHVPVQSSGLMTSITLTNFDPPGGREAEAAFTPVSQDFFRTLGIRLEKGRDFSTSDVGGPSVLVVNRAFADRFWPGRDPLRERVLNFGEKGAEVIGVAANATLTSVRESAEPMIYVPAFSFYMPSTSLIVRTTGEARVALPAVTRIVRGLDPSVPLFRVRTLEEHVGLALSRERVTAALLSAFGLLALVLAGTGLYGVVAYTTQIRGREFGIRLALGASPANLLLLVLAQGAGVAAVGVVIGLFAASFTSRVLASMLFGVAPTDGLTFSAIAALLMLASLAASVIPARRAAGVDPIQTLRSE